MRAWPQVRNPRERVALSVHCSLGKALKAYNAASGQNTGLEVEESSMDVSSTIILLGGVGIKPWTARQAQDSHAIPSFQPALLLGR